MSVIDLLRGDEFAVEAAHGSPRFYEGLRVGRDSFFCDDVVTAGSTLVLNDPARHPAESFAHHKQARAGLRFYAGVPLSIAHGPAVGALCIGDTIPHEFRSEDMRVLEALGQGVPAGWRRTPGRLTRPEHLEPSTSTSSSTARQRGRSARAVRPWA